MNKLQIALLFITSVALLTGFRENSYRDKNIRATATDVSVYEVKLTYTGYVSMQGTLEDCTIRSNGTVVLKGELSGAENEDPDDPIMYTGVLKLEIDMDICSVKRVNGEDKFCGMTVKGNGRVRTELEIDPDERGNARSAYIKFAYDSTLGTFTKSVGGTCDQQQQAEEEYMVPNKTIASIFNGSDLPMLTERMLRIGRYVDRGDEGETVVEVLRVVSR